MFLEGRTPHSSPQSFLETSQANRSDTPLPSGFLTRATLSKLVSEVERRDGTSLFLFISVLQLTLEAPSSITLNRTPSPPKHPSSELSQDRVCIPCWPRMHDRATGNGQRCDSPASPEGQQAGVGAQLN